jgi:RimJ/RimL family protein N-acetyltransferase
MSGFPSIWKHGAEPNGYQLHVDVVDQLIGGQADIVFCSSRCLRQFFNSLVDKVERRWAMPSVRESNPASVESVGNVHLRATCESDLQTFFEYHLDPIANRMAAFTAKDPNDRAAYMAKWNKNLADPTIITKTIMLDGQIVGTVASFIAPWAPSQRHVTYWIDRKHWGKGIATAALQQFLRDSRLQERPLYASAASDNLGSIRVLEKCGFTITGSEKAFANGRGEEIEEICLVLS